MLRLRQERKRQGLTQTKLAALTGIAAPDICAVERGWRKPFPGWKRRISEALGVSGTEAERLWEEVDTNVQDGVHTEAR